MARSFMFLIICRSFNQNRLSPFKIMSNLFYLNRQNTQRAAALVLALASTFLLVTPSLAQEVLEINDRSGRDKVIQMVKTDTPPIIDGIMDDVWYTGAVVDDFHQVAPFEYTEPSEETIVYVLYGENAIYVGARMIYKNPDDIMAYTMIQLSVLLI